MIHPSRQCVAMLEDVCHRDPCHLGWVSGWLIPSGSLLTGRLTAVTGFGKSCELPQIWKNTIKCEG